MTFKGELYPYQQEGFDTFMKRGRALVAYEVGLGKTPIALAAMEALMGEGEITEPGLVFTPSSTKYQWAKSIEKFTDSGPLVIDGTPAQRRKQYEQAMDWYDSGVDYIIMNYEVLTNDYKEVYELPRGFVILDESTAVKSHTSNRHKLTKKLTEDIPFRLALSGTPMANGDPMEIFNQMKIIDPSLLGSYIRFEDRHVVRNHMGWVVDYVNIPELHKRLKPAVVSKRQTDSDVAPYLPETIYKEPILVPLDRPSKVLYNKISEDLLEDLDEAVTLLGSGFSLTGGRSDQGGPEDELRGAIASKVTALRMLCSHPQLLKNSAEEFDAKSGTGSQYLSELAEDGHLDRLKRAPKVEAMSAYVRDFLEADPKNKVVIFSTYVATLELIQNALRGPKGLYRSETYSGKMNAKVKEAARERFQTDPDIRVLISSDAGGYGVDLPQANLLINYDLPWSSGTAAQRNGRIRRASSSFKRVVIQNFLTEGTPEIRQWEQLQQKNRIEAAVIEGKGLTKDGKVELTVGSLRTFLRENKV